MSACRGAAFVFALTTVVGAVVAVSATRAYRDERTAVHLDTTGMHERLIAQWVSSAKPGEVLDLHAVLPGGWDEVAVLGGYYSPEKDAAALGIDTVPSSGCMTGECGLVLLLRNSRVVAAFTCNGDARLDTSEGTRYRLRKPFFRLAETGAGRGLSLVPIAE